MITNMNTSTLTTFFFWKHDQKTWATMFSRQKVAWYSEVHCMHYIQHTHQKQYYYLV